MPSIADQSVGDLLERVYDCFFFQAEDGIRDADVTGVQTCALPISLQELERHGELFSQVSRQFQLLKPETFKLLKRLVDGEEIDLDSAIKAFVDRRATHEIGRASCRERV